MPHYTKVDELLDLLQNGEILNAVLLIHQGLDLDRDRTGLGQVALEAAIERKDYEVFKTLIDLGANVRNVVKHGRQVTLHVLSLQKCLFDFAGLIEAEMEKEPKKPHMYSLWN